MFRPEKSFMIIALLTSMFCTLVSVNAHAVSWTDSELDAQYCFRDPDGADSNDTADDNLVFDSFLANSEFPDNSAEASVDLAQIITCRDNPNITNLIFAVSDRTKIVNLTCNPASHGSCEKTSTDYTDFEVEFEFTHWDGQTVDKKTLKVSEGASQYEVGVGELGFLKMKFEKVGTKACLRATGTITIKQEDDTSGEIEISASVSTHCVFLPPPAVEYEPPSWGNIIAPVCLNYTVGHSQYATYPLSGVVVECVEETMENIFSLDDTVDGTEATTAPLFALNKDLSSSPSFFRHIQNELEGFVLAALVLYVTIFGLGVVMKQSIPSKGDFIMAVIKFALVLYFSIGTGIIDFVPRLIDMSKTVSQILMDTSKHLPISYNYCDFSNNIYPEGYESMRLWDTVDCKVSKYLGFQESAYVYDTGNGFSIREPIDHNLQDTEPKILYIAVMFWGESVGIIISIIAIPCLVFIITLLIRIVHIYIIAIMAIYFLAFLAPLIVPAALFNYTKDMFDNWLKQIISFSLQPIILFAFLALVFAISDFVMFRGNTQFCADKNTIMMNYQELSEDGTCTASPTSSDDIEKKWECAGDPTAPACVLFKHVNIESGYGILPSWSTYHVGLEQPILAFLMLLFIFFILNSILPTIEELSHRLTDASGGGASGIAGGTKNITSNLGGKSMGLARASGTVVGAGGATVVRGGSAIASKFSGKG